MTDWDRDGDLDLIVGVISGNVAFFSNEGTKTEPKFGPEQPLKGGGKSITATDGGPCIADWDGDGREDLILGDGEGGVRWFRAQRGASGIPTLEAGKPLIRPRPNPEKLPSTGPVYRTKPTVVDWNADGKPDLLVGDFYMGTEKAPPSTLKKADRDRLTRQMAAAQTRLSERVRLADKTARKEVGIAPGATISGERSQAYGEAFNRTITKDAAFRKISNELNALRRKLPQPKYIYGGNVWLYLRR